MPTLYAMKRANGQFFTILPNRTIIWASFENLEISRAHNRVLDLYQPLPLTDKIAKEIKEKFTIQGSCTIWLAEPTTTTAKLEEGRLADWAEIENLRNQPDPEPEKVETPKVRATIQEFQFT